MKVRTKGLGSGKGPIALEQESVQMARQDYLMGWLAHRYKGPLINIVITEIRRQACWWQIEILILIFNLHLWRVLKQLITSEQISNINVPLVLDRTLCKKWLRFLQSLRKWHPLKYYYCLTLIRGGHYMWNGAHAEEGRTQSILARLGGL